VRIELEEPHDALATSLETSLFAHPDDENAWSVYADRLLELGDARGERIRSNATGWTWLGHQVVHVLSSPEFCEQVWEHGHLLSVMLRHQWHQQERLTCSFGASSRFRAQIPQVNPPPQLGKTAGTRFKSRLRGVLEGLEAAGYRFTLMLGPPVSSATVKKARAAVRGQVSEEVVTFFREMNGLTLEWDEGRLAIPRMEVVFGGDRFKTRPWNDDSFRDDLWGDDFLEADEFEPGRVARLRGSRLLERLGDSRAALVHFAEDARVFLLDRWELSATSLDVVAYLEKGLDLAGLRGWQNAFLEGSRHRVARADARRRIAAQFPPTGSAPSVPRTARNVFQPGARVQYRGTLGAHRGTIVELREVVPRYRAASSKAMPHCLVAFDLGAEFQVARRKLKLSRNDRYERVRRGPELLRTLDGDTLARTLLELAAIARGCTPKQATIVENRDEERSMTAGALISALGARAALDLWGSVVERLTGRRDWTREVGGLAIAVDAVNTLCDLVVRAHAEAPLGAREWRLVARALASLEVVLVDGQPVWGQRAHPATARALFARLRSKPHVVRAPRSVTDKHDRKDWAYGVTQAVATRLGFYLARSYTRRASDDDDAMTRFERLAGAR